MKETISSLEPNPALPLRALPGAHVLVLILLLILGATLLSVGLSWLTGPRHLSLPFIVAIVLAGGWFGPRPAIVASLAAFLAYNFFIVPPRFIFTVTSADIVALASFLSAAILVGALAGKLSDRAHTATDQLRRLTTLLAASRDLSAAITVRDVAQSLARNLKSGGNVEAGIWSADTSKRSLLAATEAAASVDPKSPALAGRTETLRPLRTVRGEAGLATVWIDTRKPASPAASSWLEALLQLGAIALDRARLAEDITEARLVAEREGLRTALLSSLSHDLRTPIATILASASSLAEYDARFDAATRRELVDTIQAQADRLNRYVTNLLDMTRLESGILDLKRVLIDPVEAMNSALEHMRRRLEGRRVGRDFSAVGSGAMISVDPVLIEQALVNIIENAAEISPPDSTICTGVAIENGEAVMTIADEGPGISPEELPRVFDKFFRGQADRRRDGGVGLGLAVTKGVVEAFGGRISVESPALEGRGARFTIRLPAHRAIEIEE